MKVTHITQGFNKFKVDSIINKTDVWDISNNGKRALTPLPSMGPAPCCPRKIITNKSPRDPFSWIFRGLTIRNIRLFYASSRQAFVFVWTPFCSMGRSLNQRDRMYSKLVQFQHRIKDGVGKSVEQPHYGKKHNQVKHSSQKTWYIRYSSLK